MTSISFAVCAYLYGCAMEMSLDGIDSLQSPVNDLFSDIGFSVYLNSIISNVIWFDCFLPYLNFIRLNLNYFRV